jgi:hypothetical protein
MAKRRKGGQPVWPADVRLGEVPKEAMDAALYETYRFLFNYWVWQGDLKYLCAICYLQGAMDGAQVAALALTDPGGRVEEVAGG